jgi:uncharacterized phage protein (TIGR01671 family)
MREIEFRGKRKDDGRWIFGDLKQPMKSDFTSDETFYIAPFNVVVQFSVFTETIGQYTGLKDKKNVKIFEGDILKNDSDYIGYVQYLTQERGYVIVYEKSDSRIDGQYETISYEVIGNIYDNPNLLKNN